MKKRYKVICVILLFIIISISAGYYWLINGWKKYISKEELSSYASEIKKYPPLPNEFKELYFKLNPKHKEATLTGEVIEKIFNLIVKGYSGGAKQNCSCDDIIHYDRRFILSQRNVKEKYDPFKRIKLGFGLQQFLSNEECLNYAIRLQYSETKNSRAGYLFDGKNFDDLNREEIIDYFIAEKAPIYYSPRIYPGRYKERKGIIENDL